MGKKFAEGAFAPTKQDQQQQQGLIHPGPGRTGTDSFTIMLRCISAASVPLTSNQSAISCETRQCACVHAAHVSLTHKCSITPQPQLQFSSFRTLSGPTKHQ